MLRVSSPVFLALIKGMSWKAAGSFKHCFKPCTGPVNTDPKPYEFPFQYSFKAPVVGQSLSTSSELVLEDQEEEWEAEADEGVVIKLLSVYGGNDIQKLRFNKNLFSMWKAQKWWEKNHAMVMELWTVRNIAPRILPFSAPNSEIQEVDYFEVSFPLRGERLRDYLNGSTTSGEGSKEEEKYYESDCLTSTPKLSSVNGCSKVEASSADAFNGCAEIFVSSVTEARKKGTELIPKTILKSASSKPKLHFQEEWVAKVDEGVLMKLLSVDGGNMIQGLRCSKSLFNMSKAQMWWEENHEMIMQLWSVQNIIPRVLPFPAPVNPEEEVNYFEILFPLRKQLLDELNDPITTNKGRMEEENYSESDCLTSTPKLSSVNGCVKMEASSADATSVRSSLEENCSAEVLVHAETEAMKEETECMEENEAVVQVTLLRSLSAGLRGYGVGLKDKGDPASSLVWAYWSNVKRDGASFPRKMINMVPMGLRANHSILLWKQEALDKR